MALDRSWYFVTAIVLAACGGGGAAAGPQTATAAPTESAAAPAESSHAAATLPSACSGDKSSKLCLPEQEFVDRLCRQAWPNIALFWFRKDSPWNRVYAGRSASSAGIAAEEELIVVKQNARPAGYEVLRWDGTCASVGTDQVSTNRPATPKSAAIPWRKLSEAMQGALLSDAKVKQLYERRRKECLGAEAAGGDTPCDKAEAAFSAAISAYVRGGGSVPEPADLP